ncbi:MAG: polar amino acid transport system substrate-binding protein [Deferribacteres bacterium]|jgi:polar amino acid transport system substrate-binding protein|nr:amino acid transporter, substrate-binding protein [Deferribacteraceae bacterium]MDK2792778.1 polar amino acid transport system substrate-binding protein [Deferribacteres bacterium]
MKKFFLSFVLVFVLALSGFASDNSLWEKSTLNEIMKRGELRVGLESGYKPFEMTATNGEIIGFDVDIAKQMAKAMGVKLKLVNTAWDGIIPALITEKFDIIMSGMTITPQRNLQVNFAEPNIVVGQTILIKKELASKVKSYRDLNDEKYTIATKLGVTADFATKKYIPKAKKNLFETESDAFQDFINGKADAFIYDLPLCAFYYADYKDKLVFLDEPFTYEPLAWAVRKGDPDFLNWLNNFLRQIKNDGTYDKIYEKWFKSDEWKKQVK